MQKENDYIVVCWAIKPFRIKYEIFGDIQYHKDQLVILDMDQAVKLELDGLVYIHVLDISTPSIVFPFEPPYCPGMVN